METESQTERICGIKDCHGKATVYIKVEVHNYHSTERTKNSDYEIKEYLLVALSSHHYKDICQRRALTKLLFGKIYTPERHN